MRAKDRDKETTDSFRLYWSGMELIELHPLTLRLSRTDKKECCLLEMADGNK